MVIARGVFNHEKVSSCKKFNYAGIMFDDVFAVRLNTEGVTARVSSCKKFNYAGIMFDDVFYLFCPCIYCTSKKKSS